MVSQAEFELAAEEADPDASATHRRKAIRLLSCERGQWGSAKGTGGQIVRPGGVTMCLIEHCDHRLCGACERRRAARMFEEFRFHLADAGVLKGYTRFVTLTHQDLEGEPLKAAIKRFTRRVDKFRRRRFWSSRVRGAILAIEITRNAERRSWHVHGHLLIDAVGFIPQHELLAEWRRGYGPKDGGARIEEAGKHAKKRAGRVLSGVELAEFGLKECLKYTLKGAAGGGRLYSGDDLEVDDGTRLFPLAEIQDLRVLKEACSALRQFKAVRAYGNARGRPELPEDWKEDAKKLDELAADLMRLGFVGWDATTGDLVPKDEWHYRSGDSADEVGWRFKNGGRVVDWVIVEGRPDLTPEPLDAAESPAVAPRLDPLAGVRLAAAAVGRAK